MVHDGELVDACQLLRDLGTAFAERRGRPTREDDQAQWDLVVATPKRALELRSPEAGRGVHVVVVDKETRTLVSMLRRSGVSFLVRRPVHPLVLRLLLLHALYRGPEKRRRERVAVGAPVQFRAGLRRRGAILADLSLRGCRLLSSYPAKREQSLSVHLPPEIAGAKLLKLAGKVVRTGPASGEDSGTQAIAVVFEPMERDLARRLQQIVTRFAAGPAVLPDSAAQSPAQAPVLRPAPERAPAPSPEAVAAVPPPPLEHPEPDSCDRRRVPRREYSRTVIALGDEATRVLIGRDISTGGMRVDPNETLAVGTDLRIALHVRARTEPLVVEARVDRDDGDRGILLRFQNLSDGARDYLDKMVNFLPVLASRGEDGSEEGIVVSEILEQLHPAGAEPAPSQ